MCWVAAARPPVTRGIAASRDSTGAHGRATTADPVDAPVSVVDSRRGHVRMIRPLARGVEDDASRMLHAPDLSVVGSRTCVPIASASATAGRRGPRISWSDDASIHNCARTTTFDDRPAVGALVLVSVQSAGRDDLRDPDRVCVPHSRIEYSLRVYAA